MKPSQTRPATRSRSESVLTSGSSRRQFVKTFVYGTALSTLLGKEWLGTLLADCQPSAPGAGILRVTVADFPALAAPNGSVRLALNSFTQSGPPAGAFYPVLINRDADNQFYALRTRCSHQGCVVAAFSTAQGASVCPCHGSRYALDGTVILGPAPVALTSYPVSFDGTLLCVEIPQLGYSVTASSVVSGTNPRLRLQFLAVQGGRYEVVLRKSTVDPGNVVPFSLTETGAATTTVLTGNNTQRIVYVDQVGESGFFSVALQVSAA
jgi:Rieske Fe-S protein